MTYIHTSVGLLRWLNSKPTKYVKTQQGEHGPRKVIQGKCLIIFNIIEPCTIHSHSCCETYSQSTYLFQLTFTLKMTLVACGEMNSWKPEAEGIRHLMLSNTYWVQWPSPIGGLCDADRTCFGSQATYNFFLHINNFHVVAMILNVQGIWYKF